MDITCPNCGAGEMHPNGKWVLIRAHKVHDGKAWKSQCLVCSGYYDKDLNVPNPAAKTIGGWFAS